MRRRSLLRCRRRLASNHGVETNMRQRILYLFCFLLFLTTGHAGEFRFEHWEGCTGVCHVLYDGKGPAIPIRFSKQGNKEADAILDALLSAGAYGERGVQEDSRGVKWTQEIVLVGELSKEKKLVETSESGVTAGGSYQEFTLKDIKLVFPFSRWVTVKNERWPVEGPVILETHFDIDSIFPDGLKLDGKDIELRKHTYKSASK